MPRKREKIELKYGIDWEQFIADLILEPANKTLIESLASSIKDWADMNLPFDKIAHRFHFAISRFDSPLGSALWLVAMDDPEYMKRIAAAGISAYFDRKKRISKKWKEMLAPYIEE